jgi:hypothetical protein
MDVAVHDLILELQLLRPELPVKVECCQRCYHEVKAVKPETGDEECVTIETER